jgi:hypothetical protein
MSNGDPTDDILVEGDLDDTKGDYEELGMFILVDKEQNEEGCVDIIALHGLNGHYWNTWTATSKSGKKYNWLADLSAKIPDARVMSYGYNSAVQLSKSTASIGDFADSLLEELVSWRRSSVEKKRPVIFICHSLGGIVFKQVTSPLPNLSNPKGSPKSIYYRHSFERESEIDTRNF